MRFENCLAFLRATAFLPVLSFSDEEKIEGYVLLTPPSLEVPV